MDLLIPDPTLAAKMRRRDGVTNSKTLKTRGIRH